MKAWLGAAGRLLFDYALLLALAVALEVGASGLSGLFGALTAALRLFPLAIAAALMLGVFSFERRLRSRVLGFLSLVLLGTGLFTGGLALRRALAPPEAAAERPLPTGLAVESGGLIYYARSYEQVAQGRVAREAIAYDAHAAFPRLVYAHEASLVDGGGLAVVEGRRYPVRARADTASPLIPALPEFSVHSLAQRLAALDALPLSLAAAGAACFALLVVGFCSFARFPAWPLFGLFVGVAGLACALILDAALAGPAVAAVGDFALRRLGLGELPAPLIAALCEGALGFLVGFAGLFAPRRGKIA